MSELTKRYEELSQLIYGSLEGSLTPEQAARLQTLVTTHQWALKYYCEYITIYSDLKIPKDISVFSSSAESVLDPGLWQRLQEDERNAPAVQVTKAIEEPIQPRIKPEPSRRQISKLPLVTALVSCAALLMILIYVYLNPRTGAGIVGLMVDSVGAVWQDEAQAVVPGQDLQAGYLKLKQGLVRIRFNNGACVVLEGPALVDLLSGNSMYLAEGKIVATVGREAIGFVVNTPQGKVLDLGTQFGVRVESTGRSQVHVFQGEVVLYSLDNTRHSNISQGQARSVDTSGKVSDISVQTTAFIRPEEMDSKLLASRGDSYHRWKAWVFDIRRDPSLVAHYFDVRDASQPASLLNTAPSARGGLSGQFGSQERAAPTWVTGRWPQKSAVRFERGKNQAIVVPPDTALSVNGPITISSWVYYPDEARKGGHLISCRQDYHVNFQFSVFDQHYEYEQQRNQFEFLRFNQDHVGVYSSPFIQRAGLWYHFVVTYDMQRVCIYVNGKLFESAPYTGASDRMAAEVILGAQKLDGRYVLPEGDFDGIVDELMIFDRCMGDNEIQKIYEIGKPVSN